MRVVTRLFDSRDEAANAVDDLEASGVPSERIAFVSAVPKAVEARAFTAPPEAAAVAPANPLPAEQSDLDEGLAEVVDGAGKGAVAGAGVGLLAGLAALTMPGLGVAAAAGWLTAAFTGAATGAAVGSVTGGFLGALTDAGVDETEAQVYAESIRRGSAMVLVRAPEEDCARIERTLRRHGGVDLADRRRELLDGGWRHRDFGTAPAPSGSL